MRSSAVPGLWLRILLSRWTWPLLLICLTVLLLPADRLGRWESSCLDLAFRLRLQLGLTEPMPREILLLEIDDNDLIGLGTVASEYEANADAIRQTANLGARVIAIDAIFQRGGPEQAQPILDAIEEVRKKGTKVVLAEVADIAPNGTVPELSTAERIHSFPFLETPVEPAGLANADPDDDGVFRRYQMTRLVRGETIPSLALAAHLASLPPGITANTPSPGTIRWIELGPDFVTQIENEATGEEFWLNFREPWESDVLDSQMDPPMRRHWSLRDLEEYGNKLNAPPAESEEPLASKPFAGKTVIMGYVAEGAADRGPTPFGAREPKMMIHAQALSDYMTGAELRRAPFLVLLLFAFSPLLFCLTPLFRKNRWLVVFAIIGLLLLWIAAFYVFCHWHWLVPVALFSIVWLLTLGVELLRRVRRESLGRSALLASLQEEGSEESGAEEEPPLYWAFVSYCSADRKFVSRFHSALERYRVPVWLVGQKTDHGTRVPPRVFPVFRDRDELRGSPDLAAQLDQALVQSRTLIVVCTQASAQSKWVNEEVLRFKRMGRDSRITCIIPDTETIDPPDCFCEALRHPLKENGELDETAIEPLAADARRWRDGFTNAKMKVIAGVLGLSFDDLRQREVQRRERRLGIAIAATVLILLCAIFATIRISRDRAEQVAKRERAESVIDDLERKLQSFQQNPPDAPQWKETLDQIEAYQRETQSGRSSVR